VGSHFESTVSNDESGKDVMVVVSDPGDEGMNAIVLVLDD
jgi:hypothetical protein